MTLSTIIGVAIGLAVVYYIFGLVVSFFVAQTKQALEMKGKDLYKVLKDALGEQFDGVLDKELINKLAPYRYSPLTRLVRGLKKETTAYVEDIPVPTLATQLMKEFDFAKDEHIDSAIGTLITPAFKELDRFTRKKDSEILEIEQNAQKKIEGWLDSVMSKASDLYTKNVRTVVIVWALAVTIAFNVDTIAIGTHFYNEPAARYQASLMMDKIIEDAELVVDASTGEVTVPDDYQKQIDSLTPLNIPMGWGAEAREGDLGLRLLGWLITWVALAQGSSFWYDALKKLKVVRAKIKSDEG